jgi:hypothetical protein
MTLSTELSTRIRERLQTAYPIGQMMTEEQLEKVVLLIGKIMIAMSWLSNRVENFVTFQPYLESRFESAKNKNVKDLVTSRNFYFVDEEKFQAVRDRVIMGING